MLIVQYSVTNEDFQVQMKIEPASRLLKILTKWISVRY